MLTRNFKKLFKDVKLNIALYVIGPGDDPRETPTPSELLTVSVRMARAGVDGLLYLTDKAAQMVEFQKAMIAQKDVRERLKSYGGKAGQEVLDLVTSWEKIVGKAKTTHCRHEWLQKPLGLPFLFIFSLNQN